MNLPVLITFFSLIILELAYFKIAKRYAIVDHPNYRSSHSKVTIRGGGIIFSMALLLTPIYFGYKFGYFLVGLFLISLISFIDDIRSVSNKIRLLVHLIAATLLFQQLDVAGFTALWVITGFFLVIAVVNAFNFMDGINGITAGYSMVTLLTLYYINAKIVVYTDENYLLVVILAVLAFSLFNFRTKAVCFAGDVGSVSLAFVIVFFILQLICKTKNITYLLMLLLYGLDTASTILLRIFRRQNIFKAHRAHFYQVLVHDKKMSHLFVAFLYMLTQGIGNVFLLVFFKPENYNITTIIAIALLVFVPIRLVIEFPNKFIKNQNNVI